MASTYSNSLRLELIASGEAASTWGDKTNVNLTNIAAAFGYATQDGFAANADSTTTVADGVADPARAMYFKVTSSATLTATRTLTIAPNTISRLMWIENATTGGQSIAISQGTGANVTIPTGKTAVVYLDGAGSGAAVVDAMAGVSSGASDTLAEILAAGNTTGGTDLAVSTGDDITFADSSKAIFGADSDLQIYSDGTTGQITGNVNVTGSVTADGLTVDGDGLIQASTGAKVTIKSTTNFINANDVVGSLDFVSADYNYPAQPIKNQIRSVATNPAGTGESALFISTTETTNLRDRIKIDYNGDISFYEDTGTTPKFFWDASAESLGIGTSLPSAPLNAVSAYSAGTTTTSLKLATVGGYDSDSGTSIDFGQDQGNYATWLTGRIASSRTGDNWGGSLIFSTNDNSAAAALQERLRIASDGSLSTPTAGTANVRFGSGAGISLASGGNYNTLIGDNAGSNISTADNNTFIGGLAGAATDTGSNNLFVGMFAGNSNISGSYNTFVGRGNGYGAGDAITTGSANVILGAYSGNNGGLDIRTSDNNIVLSDGDGNPRGYYHGGASFPHWLFNTPTDSQWAMSIRHTVASGYSPYGLNIEFSNAVPNDTVKQFLRCGDATNNRFFVYSNGNVVNVNNSYGAISDEKLKENIVDSSSQWEDIKALTVRKYSMKADNLDAPNMLGVIAQEVEAAGMGGLVYESPDLDKDLNDLGTVTKQVNYSILYMKAVKALQEAMERIELLEARIAALES